MVMVTAAAGVHHLDDGYGGVCDGLHKTPIFQSNIAYNWPEFATIRLILSQNLLTCTSTKPKLWKMLRKWYVILPCSEPHKFQSKFAQIQFNYD